MEPVVGIQIFVNVAWTAAASLVHSQIVLHSFVLASVVKTVFDMNIVFECGLGNVGEFALSSVGVRVDQTHVSAWLLSAERL